MLNERNIIRLVAKTTPWLAPAPTAYFVARAAMLHLETPFYWAVIIAVTIEALGLVSVYNLEWFRGWNARKLAKDPQAPTWIPVGLSVFYLAVTVGLVTILEVLPETARFAPAVFPFLSAIGVGNLALIAGQEERESIASKARQERKQASKARQDSKASKSPAQGKRSTRQERKTSGQGKATRQGILDAYASDPLATQAQVAQALGVSRQSIGQHLVKLEQAGLIERNGQGIEVIQ